LQLYSFLLAPPEKRSFLWPAKIAATSLQALDATNQPGEKLAAI